MDAKYIFAAAGFVAGAGVGIVGSCIFLKKKYEKWANDQVEDVRQAFSKRLDEKEEATKLVESVKPTVEEVEKTEPVTQDAAKAMRDIYAGKKRVDPVLAGMPHTTTPAVDYTAYSRVTKAETDDHPLDDQELKGPTIISKEEYGTNLSLTTQELTYYMSDGILADEYENQIDNLLQIVGGTFTRSGFTSNDDITIYIRNEEEGKDFKITKVWKSYAEIFE